MKVSIGTKSLLFGAHQFIIHPVMVFIAWWKLYGFPVDPRLWIAFVIHDWGYWGKPDMDGAEGSLHPEWAANLMGRWFGGFWYNFCLYHSRFYAQVQREAISQLCVADKYSMVITPKWLYLPLVKLTGEADEYMQVGKIRGAEFASVEPGEYEAWYYKTVFYLAEWVREQL